MCADYLAEYNNCVGLLAGYDAAFALIRSKGRGLQRATWDRMLAQYLMTITIPGMGQVALDLCHVAQETGLSTDDINVLIQQGVATARPEVVTTNPPFNVVPDAHGNMIISMGRIYMTMSAADYNNLTSEWPRNDGVSYAARFLLNYAGMSLNTDLFQYVGHDIYKYIEDKSKVKTIECFACPMDKTLVNYCSPFDTDISLGSKGNFFTFITTLREPRLLIAHPPDINDMVEAFITAAEQYITTIPESGYILFSARKNERLDAGVAAGVAIGVYRKGYYIYGRGVTPPEAWKLFPPLVDTVEYTGMELSKLLPQGGGVYETTLNTIGKLMNIDPVAVRDLLLTVNGRSSLEFYTVLRNSYQQRQERRPPGETWTNYADPEKRAANRARDITPYVGGIINVAGDYVDIGAADGSISKAIGLLVKTRKVWCQDIDNKLKYEGLTYVRNLDDIPSGTVKLVTAFVVLHHVPAITGYIQQVVRMLIPGGLFIIREHAFTDDISQGQVLVEHIVYDYIIGDQTYDQALVTNRLYPRTRDNVIDLITEEGLQLETVKDIPAGLYIYYAVFRKPYSGCV